ncbi:hypothetical protein L0N33_25265, partial [Roseburia faecis]|nr:hypothetical protein [Roseburia faecis]
SAQQEIAVIDIADPKAEPINVSLNGYRDMSPAWSQDGGILYWQSTKYGVLGADGEPLGGSLLGLYSRRAAKS